MKGFMTTGWMSSNLAKEYVEEYVDSSTYQDLLSWFDFQTSNTDHGVMIRSKQVNSNLRITVSECGQKFRIHRRLAA